MTRQKRTTPEPEEQSTALALPDTPVLIAAYSDPSRMAAILERIKTDALAIALDLSTAAGRKEIASLAFKVARSKTALDEIGKTLTEDARKQIDAVNLLRRDVRETLDAVKAEVRKPLDEWEAAEAARIADLEDRLKDFTDDLPGVMAPSAEIEQVIKEIEAIPVDETWQEYQTRAQAAKTGTLNVMRDLLTSAKTREAEQAELARLRAEAAAREEADRARAAEERRKAEEARIEREKVEAAERAAQAERERAERESREREERHQREIVAAEARRERELSEAAAAAEFALNEERNRQARIKASEEEARRAFEQDKVRRAAVQDAIEDAFETYLGTSEPSVKSVAEAIMAGKIPHVTVEM